MKNLGIYNRILRLTILIGIIFLLVLSTLLVIKSKQEKIILNESTELFQKEINSLFALKSNDLQQVVYDYTYYNEFVDHLNHHDSAWYENNITTIIKSFHIDYVCVYDTSFHIVHEVSSDSFLSHGFLDTNTLIRLSDARFMNFFQLTSDGLVQISGGSVHPDMDPTHTLTKPSGYLFIAKCWNHDLLEELAALTGARVKLLKSGDAVEDSDKYTISNPVNLLDYRGNNIARINFIRSYDSLQIFHKLSVYMVLVTFCSILAIGFIFHTATKRWLDKPLKLVTSILKSEEMDQVEELRNCKGEFRMIGTLFGDFIQQKRVLQLTKERAEESDKLKTAFLSNISHEIRTPFSGILGFLNLILENKISEQERLDYAEMISQSSNRLMNTIDNIIEIAQIQAGQMVVSKSIIDINELICNIINQFKVEAAHKKLKFSFINGLPDHKCTLISDWKKIDAILSNLIDNSLKFTQKGSVEIGVRQYDESNKDLDQMLFYVRDTGIGILPEKQSRIFELFIQADGSVTRSFEGCGLGLAISKAYVEMLGGRIWVESCPDVQEGATGAVFYFTVPCLS